MIGHSSCGRRTHADFKKNKGVFLEVRRGSVDSVKSKFMKSKLGPKQSTKNTTAAAVPELR